MTELDERKQKFKSLLQEMIEAGKNPKLPLKMYFWISHKDDTNKALPFDCGTACCLCGDVAIHRLEDGSIRDVSDEALFVASRLGQLSIRVFGNSDVSESIWSSTCSDRWYSANVSDIFTSDELQHKHLTSDHNDREIAHDYIRLVMKKVEEYDG